MSKSIGGKPINTQLYRKKYKKLRDAESERNSQYQMTAMKPSMQGTIYTLKSLYLGICIIYIYACHNN